MFIYDKHITYIFILYILTYKEGKVDISFKNLVDEPYHVYHFYIECLSNINLSADQN